MDDGCGCSDLALQRLTDIIGVWSRGMREIIRVACALVLIGGSLAALLAPEPHICHAPFLDPGQHQQLAHRAAQNLRRHRVGQVRLKEAESPSDPVAAMAHPNRLPRSNASVSAINLLV